MIFRFDFGNSNDTPIGAVVDVEASNEDEAVDILKGWFSLDCPITEQGSLGIDFDPVEVRVYINPDHITKDMITETL